MIFSAHTRYKALLADTITPVSIYLKIRDKFPNSILLESSDYRGSDNSFSFICCNPVASIIIENEQIKQTFPDGSKENISIAKNTDVPGVISAFAQKFVVSPDFMPGDVPAGQFNFQKDGPGGKLGAGLFGYIGYDAVRYFENIEIEKTEVDDKIPDIVYSVFQNIIAINHFKNQAFIFSHNFTGNTDNIDQIEALIKSKNFASYFFTPGKEEKSNFTDIEFLERINLAKKNCFRGDVFQLVLSRRFLRSFSGDEFNVYRALRSINPSPYLFYFDYGSFKIFGSSPEAQFIIKGNTASIHPIAGTFLRTPNKEDDLEIAQKLSADSKENSEHTMLVDLARNDLARHGKNVRVEKFKEVQYYSHVIHLVSKVTAEKNENVSTMQLVADTFPAGTLSGAPKHEAMRLIEEYENDNRSFYGGCIGFLGFNGDFNHAIIIRSFCSRDNVLYFQAGAGIVAESNDQNELQEINNKITALRKAIEMAKDL